MAARDCGLADGHPANRECNWEPRGRGHWRTHSREILVRDVVCADCDRRGEEWEHSFARHDGTYEYWREYRHH